MPEALHYLACAVLIGAGATVVMDIWAVARKRLLGIPPLDYGLVGRWLFAKNGLGRGSFLRGSKFGLFVSAQTAGSVNGSLDSYPLSNNWTAASICEDDGLSSLPRPSSDDNTALGHVIFENAGR